MAPLLKGYTSVDVLQVCTSADLQIRSHDSQFMSGNDTEFCDKSNRQL